MVRDEEIERIAVEAVIAYEAARGWQVESVESENRGFDLISRRPHPEDPQTAIEVRFIEVKEIYHGIPVSRGTTEEHRAELRGLVSSGAAPTRMLTRARILLKADHGQGGPGWSNAALAGALEVYLSAVQRIRRRFVQVGQTTCGPPVVNC